MTDERMWGFVEAEPSVLAIDVIEAMLTWARLNRQFPGGALAPGQQITEADIARIAVAMWGEAKADG